MDRIGCEFKLKFIMLQQVLASYGSAVVPTTPLLTLPMNEGSGGTLNDTSGLGQTGVTTSPLSWVGGKLDFPGDGVGYARIPAVDRNVLGLASDFEINDDFEIQFNISADAIASGHSAVVLATSGADDPGNGNGLTVYVAADGIDLEIPYIADYTWAAALAVSTNYNIRLRFVGNFCEVFLDGVSLGNQAITRPNTSSASTDFNIGTSWNGFGGGTLYSFAGLIWGISITKL